MADRGEQRMRLLVDSLSRELTQVDADTLKLSRLIDELESNRGASTSSSRFTSGTTSIAINVSSTTTSPTSTVVDDSIAIRLALLQSQLDGIESDDARYQRLIHEYEARLRGLSNGAPVRTNHVPLALEYDSSGVQRSTRPPFIFAISSGRTGTKFFQQLLGSARHVQCFHELHPLMSHDYLRLPYWETYHERMSVKAGAIAARISELKWPIGTAYCDTSNYFIKSWWDVAVDRFAADYPMVIVIVRRRMADVLKSMIDLNWFGGVGRPCGKFLYTANSNISFIQSLAADEEMDHFDKALSHLFDVEAKAQFFKRRFGNHPNIRIHEVCLEQVLRSVDAARRFLVSIGLEPTPASDFVLMSNDTNSRVEKKHGELANVTYTQQRIDAFVARYRERNMWLPVAPHADAAYCAKPL